VGVGDFALEAGPDHGQGEGEETGLGVRGVNAGGVGVVVFNAGHFGC